MVGDNEKPLVEELNPMISKYVELGRYIKAETAKVKEKLKPYADARDKLSNYLSAILVQNKLKRLGGNAGTAFNSTIVRYKVVDARAYLNWLLQTGQWETAKIEPIASETDSFASEQFEKFLEESKNTIIKGQEPKFEHFLPPGVTRTVTTILKVRANGEAEDA